MKSTKFFFKNLQASYKIPIFAENNEAMRSSIRIILLWISLFSIGIAQAQIFTNDFENQLNWNQPWLNLNVVADTTTPNGSFVCLCDSIHDFGLGFNISDDNMGQNPFQQNLKCHFNCLIKYNSNPTDAQFVISIEDKKGDRYWQAYPIANLLSDTSDWARFQIDVDLPFDYIHESQIKGYIWNRAHEVIRIDDAQLEIAPMTMQRYLPVIEFNKDATFVPESYPKTSDLIPIVEYIDANGDTLMNPSVIETQFRAPLFFLNPNEWENHASGKKLEITAETRFKEDIKLLRLAYALPLPEGKITVYRRNHHIDSTNLQSTYYLDREGFSIESDTFSLYSYHNTNISSLQLDVENRIAYFNIDYWRDHPLIHYPLIPDTSDVFEDVSYREIRKGETISSEFTLYYNLFMEDLPRLMPVWDGYQSAFIFTEHADWTDLRTHRAVLFGNESITKPKDAIGGFCHYDIPVTKSVFYWNPDNVTNEKTSNGHFTEPVTSIKTDKEFFKLLKTIKKEGFEICLHTPEIYTTIPSEMPKAMRFMRRQFGTKSWIDHGYNNGADKNREDMVCDGLLPESPFYSADFWRKNGVRYLWNAYYEENRMEDKLFDGHFVQPYDGFGDALPNRQITTLPNGDKDFLLWSTPSTLEVNEDHEWYYYFDSIRLQRLVDQHNVFITHVYPARTNPWRGFWQFNENGTVVAMPGFNFALSQLAHFREEKKILPTTIEKYLSYYEKIQNLDYLILDNKTIQLTNPSEAIEGLTLLCTKPIVVEGKTIDFRKVDEGYLVWFDLGKNETAIIKYRE